MGCICGAESVQPSLDGGSGEIEAEVEASAENGQPDLELVEAWCLCLTKKSTSEHCPYAIKLIPF